MTKEGTFGEAGDGEDRKGKKKTMGRQKIEMKPIECMEKRQVCFSKRRTGLFKKASDLSVLCGAHVAVVAYSPGGKPFVFGHPSVQALIDRFTDASEPATAAAAAAVHPALLEEFSRESDLLAKAIEAEASRKKALDEAMRQAGVWTGLDDAKRSLPELLAMRSNLERVQAEAAERAHEFMAKEAMMQRATSTDVGGGGIFHYPGAGTFMADGGVNSHHDQAVIDTQMTMMMGGGVDHALPFAPLMLPPPPMPYPPNNHCFDLNNDHCPVFGADGFYGAMTCNFF